MDRSEENNNKIRVPAPRSLQPAGEDRQANGQVQWRQGAGKVCLFCTKNLALVSWLSATVLAVLSFRLSSRKGPAVNTCPYFSAPPTVSFHAAGDSDFHLTDSAFRLPDHSSLHLRAAASMGTRSLLKEDAFLFHIARLPAPAASSQAACISLPVKWK